jgi:tetratricopeptide (TPR) repeat protein
MHVSHQAWFRAGRLSLALMLAIVSVGAQGRGGLPAGDLVRQARAMIAHGDLPGAARLVENAPAGPLRETAAGVLAIARGEYPQAIAHLTPVATSAPLGEAALELGLLEIRIGQRAAGRRRLEPIASLRTFNSPDDYFRLARAARGTGEFLLSNDAYQRVADEPRPDIQTSWGDLFFERHQPADAVQSYRKALELDPRWAPAAVGLARALADDDPEAAQQVLDAARQQAPDNPDVWVAAAQQALDREDTAAANEALDRAITLNPNFAEAVGVRAAVAYKTQGLQAADTAAAALRAINPESALAYRLASEQATHDYRFEDAAALARKGTAIDPEDGTAFFDLGLALLRTGDEPAARTALETSWDLDKSGRLTKNLLDLLDHLDTFDVVAHNDFVFKFAREEAPVLKAYALPLADEAYRQYKERYGFTPQGPILVEVFPRHDDFAVRTLGLPGLTGALGACFGRVVSMDSPRARPPGDFSWQATLWHELAHVFTLQMSDYRVPRWLTEGISVYEEHRRQPAWGRELALEFAHQLGKGQTFGVKKLPDAFKHPESLSLAYFEASLLVEHLVALNGEGGLRTLLLAYKNGAKDADAFTQAFGRSVDDVETSFAAFVNERYGALKNAMADPPQKVDGDDLAALRARAASAPGNFVSQLSLGQALVKQNALDEARQPLQRAAALAPPASGGGSPHALLAQIAITQGDDETARRELRQLLEFDHTNIDAARTLAGLAAKAQDVPAETYALRLVADLDPFDADTHARLGARLMAVEDVAGALVEFQAVVALGAANPADAHTNLADALLRLGRKDEARREALEALRQAPTYARAQDILLKASAN